MRIVILCSSVYSETACAISAHLARSGYVPVGAISLPTLDRRTLLRKIKQLGIHKVARYARSKIAPQAASPELQNPHLGRFLASGALPCRNLRQIARRYDFPIEICRDQNSPASMAHLRRWSPDLIVFAGGDILRAELLAIPRLGVLNVHLGQLPQVRGMSAPAWSLLKGVPPGISIHYIDAGIDTGPILKKYEYPSLAACASLTDLRHRLIAFGVEKIAEVIAALDRETISPHLQDFPGLATGESQHQRPRYRSDSQHFVMHEYLERRAAQYLAHRDSAAFAGAANE